MEDDEDIHEDLQGEIKERLRGGVEEHRKAG